MPDLQLGINQPPVNGVSHRRSLAVWIWSVLLIAEAVLITRRLSGEFASPMPGSLALLSTAFVAVASWTAWFVSAAGCLQRPVSDPQRLFPQGISLAVTVLWGWSISSGAAPLTCGLLLAVILLHVGALAICDVGNGSRSTLVRLMPDNLDEAPVDAARQPCDALAACQLATELATRHPPLASQFTAGDLETAFDDEEDEESEDDADEDLTLWLSRRQTTDGEQIEGWVRVQFAPGQRETAIHVAFCPPLSGSPEIETEDLNGVGLEIRVAAVFPFGARLSVRRSDSLEERHTGRIGFVAQVRSANRAA